MYSKDYPDSILQESGSTRLQLEIPYKQANPVPKRGRARKHIRITEQWSLYVDNKDDSSWFNTGENDLEDYGIKMVEDVSMFVDGGLSDDELEIGLDRAYKNYDKNEFNEVKQLNNKYKL